MSSTFGLPWWISPLQGNDWIVLRKFIIEESSYSSVWATIDITRLDPLSWPIILALTLDINMNFLLKLLKLREVS